MGTMRPAHFVAFSLFARLAVPLDAQRPASFDGNYAQHFDALPTRSVSASALPAAGFPHFLAAAPFADGVGLEGWFVFNDAGNALAYRAYDLTGTSSGFANFGRAAAGGGDRALGGISNGSTAKPGVGVILRNDTGNTIDTILLSYAGEQWRGTDQSARLAFRYLVSSTPDFSGLTFSSPGGAFDFVAASATGSIPGDTRGRTRGLGGTLTNLNWPAGHFLVMQWIVSQADAGLAVDDLRIALPPTPATSKPMPPPNWIYSTGPYAYSLDHKRWFRLAGANDAGAFEEIPADALFFTPPSDTLSPAYDWEEADPATSLAWPARAGAVSYNVYFGTSSSLTAADFRGTQISRRHFLPPLAPHTRYFWRVDAVDAHGVVTAGPLWHFRTGAPRGDITLVNLMPAEPSEFVLRDWKRVARDFDRLSNDFDTVGPYLPVPFYLSARRNFAHAFINMPSFIGHDALTGALGTMSNVIGATLSGVDKSNDPLTGLNHVTMQASYHSVDKGFGVLYHSPTAGPAQSMWYQLVTAASHWQLVDLYPELATRARLRGNDHQDYTMDGIMRTNADRWRDAAFAMRGDYAHFAFNFSTMEPDDNGTKIPHTAGTIAWLLYTAYQRYGDESYLAAADDALSYLHRLEINPAHDLLLPYAGIAAARMNAELGRNYDVGKFINWHFDNNGDVNESTGVAAGEVWGGHAVDGLAGKPAFPIEKVYPANTFHSAGILAPVARYDTRYARALGKWLLHVAVNSRYFYPPFVATHKQETASVAWANANDPAGCIAYEFLGKDSYFINKSLADHSTPRGNVLAGDYTTTFLRDQNYLRLQGTATSSNRLQHIWRFELPSGWVHKLRLRGYIAGTGAENGFRFSYSKNPAGPWTPIFTFTDTSDVERTANFAEATRPAVSPISGTVYIRVEDLGPLPAAGPDELRLDFLQVQTFDANTSPYLGGGYTAHGGTTDLCFYQSAQVGYLAGLVEPTNVPGVLQIDLLATDFHRNRAWPTYLYHNPKSSPVIVTIDVGPEPVAIYDAVSHEFINHYASGSTPVTLPADAARVLVLTPANGVRYYWQGRLYVSGVVVDYSHPDARTLPDAPSHPSFNQQMSEALQAAPDGGGMSQLMKYALALPADVSITVAQSQVLTFERQPASSLALRLHLPQQRGNVRYTLLGSHDLRSWYSIAEAEGNAPFMSLVSPPQVERDGEFITFGPLDETAEKSFFRLKVELRDR